MKKISLFLFLAALLSNTVRSQGICTSQCAIDFVGGLNRLFTNSGTSTCHTQYTDYLLSLTKDCAYNTCSDPVDRKVFLIKQLGTATQDTTVRMRWPSIGPASGIISAIGGEACIPSQSQINTWQNCGTNYSDWLAIKKISGGVLVSEHTSNITGIANPRMVTPADAFWPYVGTSAYNDPEDTHGVLVDVTIVGGTTYTGMLWHRYNFHTLVLKQSCPETITVPTSVCMGVPVNMSVGNANPTNTYNWNFGDGTWGTGLNQAHTYSNPGNYVLSISYGTAPVNTYTNTVQIGNCAPLTCSTCIGGFAPDAGNYIISLWVKEDNTNANPPAMISYPNTGIKISFNDAAGNPIGSPATAFATTANPIIDGWQRIETGMTIPSNAATLSMELVNNNSTGIDSYYDDIRIHPIDANMKSYVYDPVTLRLVTELDENNYGTFYEYDEEGKLIRVKKETEKGIMTLKETRISNKKR